MASEKIPTEAKKSAERISAGDDDPGTSVFVLAAISEPRMGDRDYLAVLGSPGTCLLQSASHAWSPTAVADAVYFRLGIPSLRYGSLHVRACCNQRARHGSPVGAMTPRTWLWWCLWYGDPGTSVYVLAAISEPRMDARDSVLVHSVRYDVRKK